MNMKVILDEGAFMPTRAHMNDAGLDLYAKETMVVSAKESATFDTGVHKPLKEKKICVICEKEFSPWNKNQVTCGGDECKKKYHSIQKSKKRGVYKYARNGGLTKPSRPTKKKVKPWNEYTPEERWERMSLTELSAEIARLYKGMSFGKVRLLKEQGKLVEEFGLRCREC